MSGSAPASACRGPKTPPCTLAATLLPTILPRSQDALISCCAGLQCISALSKLTELDISKCPGVTSAVTARIATLRSLRCLDLSATSIKGASFTNILPLTQLTSLNVAGLRDVGDSAVQQLRSLMMLQHLNIGALSNHSLQITPRSQPLTQG